MKVFAMFVALVLLFIVLLLAWTLYGVWQIEKRYPPVGEFIEVDGLRLHYVDAGPKDAAAIILVHGASANLRDFTASLLPALSQTHRVLAFDRPGFGHSQRGDADEWCNPSALADLLLKATEQLGIDRPVILGHSWAGSVVMSAMVEHEDRIAGGIMLSAVAGHWAGSVGWTYDVGNLPILGNLFAHLLVYPAGQFMLEQSIDKVFAPNRVTDDYIKKIAVPLALRPATFKHNVEDMMTLSEYMQELSTRYDQIDKPLLVIHGEADTLVPFWNHGRRLIPVIEQLQVALLPGVGHVPHHSNTEEVSGLITGFVNKLNQ